MISARGRSVLKWIRSTPPFAGLPVFGLTLSSFEADRQHAAQLGANRYVVKPGHLYDLVALAQSLAAFRRNPSAVGGSGTVVEARAISPCVDPRDVLAVERNELRAGHVLNSDLNS